MSEQRNERDLRKIPLTADNAVPIMFWEPVDFICAMSVFGFCMVLHLFVLGLLGCVLTLKITTQLRRGAKRGAAQHWLWFMGANVDIALARMKLRANQNDFIR